MNSSCNWLFLQEIPACGPRPRPGMTARFVERYHAVARQSAPRVAKFYSQVTRTKVVSYISDHKMRFNHASPDKTGDRCRDHFLRARCARAYSGDRLRGGAVQRTLLGLTLSNSARAQIGNGRSMGVKSFGARGLNWLLEHAGYRGTGSDAAKSFLHFPHTHARVGAIAVLWRKGGGHVGIVSGSDRAGNPVLISGNHGHRVYEATYPRSRVLAYVVPANSDAAPDKAPNTIADFEPDDAAHRRIIDSVHKRIIAVPPVRVRQRVVSNSGEAEITPGTVSIAVSRTAMLQGSNRASRSDPPAGQE